MLMGSSNACCTGAVRSIQGRGKEGGGGWGVEGLQAKAMQLRLWQGQPIAEMARNDMRFQ